MSTPVYTNQMKMLNQSISGACGIDGDVGILDFFPSVKAIESNSTANGYVPKLKESFGPGASQSLRPYMEWAYVDPSTPFYMVAIRSGYTFDNSNSSRSVPGPAVVLATAADYESNSTVVAYNTAISDFSLLPPASSWQIAVPAFYTCNASFSTVNAFFTVAYSGNNVPDYVNTIKENWGSLQEFSRIIGGAQ